MQRKMADVASTYKMCMNWIPVKSIDCSVAFRVFNFVYIVIKTRGKKLISILSKFYILFMSIRLVGLCPWIDSWAMNCLFAGTCAPSGTDRRTDERVSE